jgi:hypothetical protein
LNFELIAAYARASGMAAKANFPKSLLVETMFKTSCRP